MKKIIITVAALVLLITAAFWVKGYYNDRYVASEFYFTQIPSDEVNEESWLMDSDGVKQQKGKEYHLIGYDEQGTQREVFFTRTGDVENYYAPGTYIKASMSKTITVGTEVVQETDVPQAALEKISAKGTRTE